MMPTTYQDLRDAIPAQNSGVLVDGTGADGDLRIALQVAFPGFGDAVLGNFILGTDVLTGLDWVDVTGYCQGWEWDRGSEPPARPETGLLRARLDQIDPNDPSPPVESFAPWASFYNGPGTFVRVITMEHVNAPTSPESLVWTSLFVGMVESWQEQTSALGQLLWIDVVAVEVPTYVMAQVNDVAVAPEGLGDFPFLRIVRLMGAADTDIGNSVDYNLPSSLLREMQATEMAQNRLTEMYVVADSVDALLYSGKDGQIRLRERGVDEVDWVISTTGEILDADVDVPVVADSFLTRNDDDLIVASVTLAQVGATAVTYTNEYLVGRYRRRSTQRLDLVTRDIYANADLDFIADRILARGDETYRPYSVQLDSTMHPNVAAFLSAIEIGEVLNVRNTLGGLGIVFSFYSVAKLANRVTVGNDDDDARPFVVWTAGVHFGVEHVSTWTLIEP
jgi:hypothetical protein